MRFLFACEDAGAARGLAPVATLAMRRGDDVHFLLGPVAGQTFTSAGIALPDDAIVRDAADLELRAARAVDGVSAILTGSTCWNLRLEAHAVVAAKRQGVPTLTFLDFWSNYAKRLSYPGEHGLELLPDRLCTIDETMDADLIALGVGPSILRRTGSPAFDALLTRSVAPPPQGSRDVVFLSQPLAALYPDRGAPDHPGYTEHDALAALAPAVGAAEGRLRVRPHPREDARALADFLRTLPCRAELDAITDSDASIAAARLVTGMTTMALVEVAVLGRLPLSIQIGRRGDDPLPTNRSGWTVRADTADDVAHWVRRSMSEPLVRAPSGEAMKPGAAERVLAVVDSLVMSSQRPASG